MAYNGPLYVESRRILSFSVSFQSYKTISCYAAMILDRSLLPDFQDRQKETSRTVSCRHYGFLMASDTCFWYEINNTAGANSLLPSLRLHSCIYWKVRLQQYANNYNSTLVSTEKIGYQISHLILTAIKSLLSARNRAGFVEPEVCQDVLRTVQQMTPIRRMAGDFVIV